jgi:hypothetical protein
MSPPDPHLDTVTPSVFPGFRFPPEVIALAVRRYLRFGLLPLEMSSGYCSVP